MHADILQMEEPLNQPDPLPQLRFEITEVAKILRISRATLYGRIREGLITPHKDGRRTFITSSELQRYVEKRTQPPGS
jgi:excisionase family DNA binding protein